MTTVLVSLMLLLTAAAAHAQVPVVPSSDHESMLRHADPQLAKNKRLVYDFWREVFEAGHMDLAPKYMAETYIQHNPRVPTGRQAFIDFFSKIRKPALSGSRPCCSRLLSETPLMYSMLM